MAAALAGIGTIRYSYAEYTESLARFQEALALHQKTDDVAGIAFVSLNIGNIGFLQGDFPAAIAAYRRALDLHRTMFNADGESRALEGLGRVYTRRRELCGRARGVRSGADRQAPRDGPGPPRAGRAEHR